VIIQCSIPASPTIPAPTAPTKESTTTEPAKIQANESTVNGNVPHFPTYAATTIYPITNQTTEIVITTEATEVATTTETTTDELVTTEGTDKLNITSTDGSTPQAMSVPGNEETFPVDSASTTFTDEKINQPKTIQQLKVIQILPTKSSSKCMSNSFLIFLKQQHLKCEHIVIE